MAKKDISGYLIVREFLKSAGGDHAQKLVKICESKKKPVTDEEIGKKLPLKITEIRTVLNRLHFRGIACYNKTRNKKTGWYSYTWEIRPKRIAELILEQQTEEIQKLEKKIEFEKNYDFFACKKNCAYHPFEIAAEYQFKCPNCGQKMDSVNNEKRLKELEKQIKTIKGEVEELQKNF
ncbi:MAG: hypothetical protein V1494_03660 [Candidatus Diapherotrites archaeon]